MSGFPLLNSLHCRLMAIAAGVVVAATALLTWAAVHALGSALETEVLSRSEAEALDMASALDARLQAYQQTLARAAAQLRTDRLDDPAYLERFLRERFAHQPYFQPRGVDLLGADGRSLADYPPIAGRRGAPHGDRAYFQRALRAGTPIVGNPVLTRAGRHVEALPVAAPVRDASGKVVAVLVGVVDPDAAGFLSSSLHARFRGSAQRFIVILHSGLVVASTDPAQVMRPLALAGHSPIADLLRTGYEGSVVTTNRAGVQNAYAIAHLHAVDWAFVQAVPTAVLLAPVRHLRLQLLLGGTLAAALALGACAWLLQRALAPLREASARLDAMSREDWLAQPLDEGGALEIRRLLSSFNRLGARLRASTEQLRAFVRAAPVSMAMFDRQLRYLACSDRWLAEYGRGRHDLSGLSHYELYPDLPQRWHEVHLRALAGQKLGSDRDEWTSPDGTRRFLRWAVVPWRNTGGEVAGLVMSAEDITGAVQAQDALAEREARYRAVVETAVDGFLMVDAVGRVRDANQAYAEASGYSREQLLSLRLSDLFADEGPQEVAARIARIRSKASDTFIARQRRRDGSIWPAEWRFVFWASAGGRCFGMARDISERLDVERRIIDAATAEQERIGQEIHDGIGQGLTAVSLLAGALRRQLQQAGQGRAAASLDSLILQLEQLQRDARLLAHGLSPLHIGPDGLESALRLLVDNTRAASEIACSLDIRGPIPDLPPVAALHLYRIAQEAIGNALRHARARSIEVVVAQEASSLRLRVCDDGIGLAGEDSTRKGLGLSILQYRARSIGATLSVRGAPGAGTCVDCLLRLPAVAAIAGS